MWRKYNKTNQIKLNRFYIAMYVAVFMISLVAPLIVNTPKAYAGATTDQNEQHKRTQMAALKYCLENYLPQEIRTNVQNKVSEFNIFNSNEGKGPSVAVGYEIEGDGTKQCGELDGSVTDLGYSSKEQFFADIYRPCTAKQQLKDCALFTSKDEVIKKVNKFIEDRSLQKAEKMRRLMHTFENECATPDAGNPLESPGDNPNFIKINDSWFRWKSEIQAAATLPIGQDMNPAHLTCKKISEELKDLGAYTTSNEFYKRAVAEEQCIAEGRTSDLVQCIEEKLLAGVEVPPGPGEGDGSGGGEKTKVECDTISWNPLKWFLCPVILIAEKAVDALDKLITYMLTFPTKAYFDNNAGMQQAWSRFRNLSIGLLLIAGLVMVISQAIGTGPFDAYTIKRVMPRMLFAVVFISISWSVLRIMIEFTNIAGVGVRNLIETAFGSESFGNITFNNGSMSIGVLTGAGMGLSLGFMGILSLLGTALLGVLIAFVVLAMRQMVIIMLVILAPVAIACYILPNTEKVWKMWWDFFIRAIFAFPIISMFIAVGHAFAAISANSTTVEGGDAVLKDTIASLIAFAAYFGPYFALPYAFKLAGGAVAQIGGVVNDRSRGAFDRMKNYRKQKTAQNMSDWAHGDRFSSNNVLARGVNRVGIGAKSGWKGRFGMGERGEKARARIMQAGADATLASNKELEGFLNRDDDGAAVLGLSGGTSRGAREAAADLRRTWIANGTSEAEATARADRALAAASAMGVNRQNAGAAWTKMAQNKSRAIPSGDIETIQRGSQRLAGGNATAAQEMAWSQQFHSRGAGRVAEGGDWTSTEVQGHLDAAANARQAGNNALADHHTFEAQRATFMDGVKRTGVGSLTSGHSSATAMANQVIQEGLTSADPTRRLESATLLSELAGQLPGATGENRDNIAGALLAAGIDPNLVESAGKAPVAIGTNPDGSIIYQMQQQDAAVSIDQQLVRIVNAPIPGIPGGATGTVTTKDLDVIKRSWGSTPPGARTT